MKPEELPKSYEEFIERKQWTGKIAIDATPDPVRLIRIHVNGRQVGEETPDIGSGGFARESTSRFDW